MKHFLNFDSWFLNRFNINLILSAIFLFISSALADSITIYNKTHRDLYLGIYYRFPKLPLLDQKPGQLATPIQCIHAQSSAIMERPDRWYGADRQLVFVEDASLLFDTLWPTELDALHALLVGNVQGNSFYIGLDSKGEYQGYTALQWSAIHKPLAYVKEQMLNLLPAVACNQHKKDIAYVREGLQLCDQEVAYLQNRKPVIQQALEKNNLAPSKIPNVSVVCSGGGFRAMLYAVGALKGLHRSGVLDLASYLVGLSGSTWAIATWISSGLSLEAFYEWLINNIGYQLNDLDEEDFTLMGEVLLTKYCMGQPIGFVDMYGSFIANDLFDSFSHNKIMVHLSDQAEKIADGHLPMPVYTSISGEHPKSEYLWYEFTPYEVGAHWLNAYVPTWAFGRKFKNGISVTNCPEQPLGTLLGTFGLAVGVTVDRMFSTIGIEEKVSSALLKKVINVILKYYGTDRLVSAEYYNFAFGLKDRRFNDLEVTDLVDAGINCNIPYCPISGVRPERKADIIIMIDASAGEVGGELKKIEAYAKWHYLPFPEVDYSQINQHAVSVFKDEHNPHAPIVIYVPRIVDETLLAAHASDYPELYVQLHNFDIEQCITNESCNTFNFLYTPAQASRMVALGEFNALMSKDIILENIATL